MTKFSEAICFATKAFDGMYRKGEHWPAIIHSLEVAAITGFIENDEDTICAALLHDTVEDTDTTIEEIKEKFGERIAYLVSMETENKMRTQSKEETWLIRKKESLERLRSENDLSVKAIVLADKLSNLRSFAKLKFKFGNEMWNSFNQKDPNEHKKYYKAIKGCVKELSHTQAYKEYCELLEKIFEE